MDVTINIEVNQIIGMIRQLPPEDRSKILNELERDQTKNALDKKSALTELLLSGPVMTEIEEENFKNIKRGFDTWTKNVFA
jgi:hypothetical protein